MRSVEVVKAIRNAEALATIRGEEIDSTDNVFEYLTCRIRDIRLGLHKLGDDLEKEYSDVGPM